MYSALGKEEVIGDTVIDGKTYAIAHWPAVIVPDDVLDSFRQNPSTEIPNIQTFVDSLDVLYSLWNYRQMAPVSKERIKKTPGQYRNNIIINISNQL